MFGFFGWFGEYGYRFMILKNWLLKFDIYGVLCIVLFLNSLVEYNFEENNIFFLL